MDVPKSLLGYRGDPKWRDMSDYLVHFTESATDLQSILAEHSVRAGGPYGWARKDSRTRDRHMCACLSEIPVDTLDRLTQRHGRFGIGFRRSFIASLGGHRVWYLDDVNDLQTHLFNAFKPLYSQDPKREANLWHLSPFIDRVQDNYDFVWEREWRIPGGVSFQMGDVAFLIVPGKGGARLLQNPDLGAPMLSLAGADFVKEAFDKLGGTEDIWVDQFLNRFANPYGYVSWDKETGDYFWMEEPWSTESAVESLDLGLGAAATASLVDRLSGISPKWVPISDSAGVEDQN